jgi:hypothetical protein
VAGCLRYAVDNALLNNQKKKVTEFDSYEPKSILS